MLSHSGQKLAASHDGGNILLQVGPVGKTLPAKSDAAEGPKPRYSPPVQYFRIVAALEALLAEVGNLVLGIAEVL